MIKKNNSMADPRDSQWPKVKRFPFREAISAAVLAEGNVTCKGLIV